ncbi:hypothetical protein LXA47_05245 [Massilia sp. P8910]|uniref:hypothetical protein n=1 Tax=Massilia antarctica TaxID=2765360 RepID=UPI001E3004A7|nr:MULTISPECIES: hypothetical protein [Massilia]MCE3603008.1 hypothetical protein [Massilia antarctica]MCY0915460.1 hypothetical protein [Massilia sp. H27-R4]
MLDSPHQSALLANLAGAHLPPVTLSVSSQYQFCVDAGVAAAVGFFQELACAGMHDHIACSMQVFMSSVRVGMAAMNVSSPGEVQACMDAFAAGYLGRVQQELRLFHGEHVGRHQAPEDARTFMRPHTSH